MMTGFFMARVRHMLLCVDFVAVAVNAIVCTPGGSKLLTSPNSEKAVRKLSPLRMMVKKWCTPGENSMC